MKNDKEYYNLNHYNPNFGDPKKDLVELKEGDYNLVFDIKYATTDNFTNRKIYNRPFVYVHKDALEGLKLASERASLLGYKIKIFDAWRPHEAQRRLFEYYPDPNYVTEPENGQCGHCRGASLDLTLVDYSTEEELDMGTEYDFFGKKSHHDSKEITLQQYTNRNTLAGIMCSAGFGGILPTEWWHYNLLSLPEYPKYRSADLGIDLIAEKTI